MFKKLLIGLVVLVVILVAVGFFLPSSYEVKRSVVIDAKPSAVHKYVGNLEKWGEWEPWTEGDPTIETTLGKKTSGVGASQTWTGKEGDGKLTFTASDSDKGIEYDMEFDGGKWKSKGAMRYEAVEKKTTVTWEMTGTVELPVIGGYMALMMDGWTGPYFEKGLAKLKAKVES